MLVEEFMDFSIKKPHNVPPSKHEKNAQPGRGCCKICPKILKSQRFIVKNAIYACAMSTELHQLFVKLVKIYSLNLFMPFLFLDHNGPRYVCT